MILAASNLAWKPDERIAAYTCIAEAGFRGLEIAPGLYFPEGVDTFSPSEREVSSARAEHEALGLELVSMQSLLYGTTDAALFGPPDAFQRFVEGMERAIRLAGVIGCPNLVFGSPRQRIVPTSLSPASAQSIATETFSRLGDLAAAAGAKLSLEFNPTAYGANYWTTWAQVHAFVTELAHPAVRVCFDIGATYLNDEVAVAPDLLVERVAAVGHVHVSAPHLGIAPVDHGDTVALVAALKRARYGGAVSIEMLRPADEPLVVLAHAASQLASAVAVVNGGPGT